MIRKLAHLSILFQANSAKRRGILGQTPSTTVLLNSFSSAWHSRRGSKGVAGGDIWRPGCAWLRWSRDYDVRGARGEPRGWKSGGSSGGHRSSRPARIEGGKRLLSATRKP